MSIMVYYMPEQLDLVSASGNSREESYLLHLDHTLQQRRQNCIMLNCYDSMDDATNCAQVLATPRLICTIINLT